MMMSDNLVTAGYGDVNVSWAGHGQRNDDSVLNWDETFITLAHVVAKRSKDPSTQVGAVIVDRNNRILSLGYNGAPTGFNDDDFPWGKTSDNPACNKYMYVVHAEENAILNYRGSRADLEGASIYVSLSPCNECAKSIIQSGIKHVIYDDEPREPHTMDTVSRILLERCGVSITKYDGRSITINVQPAE